MCYFFRRQDPSNFDLRRYLVYGLMHICHAIKGKTIVWRTKEEVKNATDDLIKNSQN